MFNEFSENFVKDPQSDLTHNAVAKRLVWPIFTQGIFPLQIVLDDINDSTDDVHMSATIGTP